MKKGINKNCLECGKEHYRPQSHKDYNFCSKLCANKSREKALDVKCNKCGKLFTRVPSQMKSLNYCSYECSSSARKEEIKPFLTHPVEETRKGGRKRMQDKLWSSKYADKVFSEWIRARDKKCISCGRTSNLTCSHFWNRNMSSVRYDPINCDTLCWLPCHMNMEKQKQGKYMELKMNQLGQDAYMALRIKAHTSMQRSDAIKELMSWLNGNRNI